MKKILGSGMLAIVAVVAATAIVAAYFFARCTEAHTDAVRAWLEAVRLRLWQDWRSGTAEAKIIAFGDEMQLSPLEPIRADSTNEIRLSPDTAVSTVPETAHPSTRSLKL